MIIKNMSGKECQVWTEFSLHGAKGTTSTLVTWDLEMRKAGSPTHSVGPWGII